MSLHPISVLQAQVRVLVLSRSLFFVSELYACIKPLKRLCLKSRGQLIWEIKSTTSVGNPTYMMKGLWRSIFFSSCCCRFCSALSVSNAIPLEQFNLSCNEPLHAFYVHRFFLLPSLYLLPLVVVHKGHRLVSFKDRPTELLRYCLFCLVEISGQISLGFRQTTIWLSWQSWSINFQKRHRSTWRWDIGEKNNRASRRKRGVDGGGSGDATLSFSLPIKLPSRDLDFSGSEWESLD